jgi:hypothetical protein
MIKPIEVGILAVIGAAAVFAVSHVRAQNVYRCDGNVYQATPCAGAGKQTDIPLTGYPEGQPFPQAYLYLPPGYGDRAYHRGYDRPYHRRQDNYQPGQLWSSGSRRW